jgi:hypothetical protein
MFSVAATDGDANAIKKMAGSAARDACRHIRRQTWFEEMWRFIEAAVEAVSV